MENDKYCLKKKASKWNTIFDSFKWMLYQTTTLHIYSNVQHKSWFFDILGPLGYEKIEFLPSYCQLINVLTDSFYNIKNGLSIITSKSSSKNLSIDNKHTLCFQRIVILIQVLSWRQQKHQCLFSSLRFFDKLFL